MRCKSPHLQPNGRTAAPFGTAVLWVFVPDRLASQSYLLIGVYSLCFSSPFCISRIPDPHINAPEARTDIGIGITLCPIGSASLDNWQGRYVLFIPSGWCTKAFAPRTSYYSKSASRNLGQHSSLDSGISGQRKVGRSSEAMLTGRSIY